MSQRVSPDGMYYWDGAAWVSTLSPDGRYRWNGAAWAPVTGPAYAIPSSQRPVREATSWTRPLQYAVIAWYGFSAIYALTLPFWMGGAMSGYVQSMVQRQQAAYPPGEAPPPGFADMMTTFMTWTLWFAAIFAVAVAAVAIIGALRRWVWVYYAILVLLGLGLLAIPFDVGNVISGGAVSNVQGMELPVWTYLVALMSALLSAALFAGMLFALVKRGPWAMRRVG